MNISLLNKCLLNTYYLLGTGLITENISINKRNEKMFQEKWSEDKESELKGREEEEVSEKVTGGICRPLECGAAPLIALRKTEYKHLFLISNSQIKAISKAW